MPNSFTKTLCIICTGSKDLLYYVLYVLYYIIYTVLREAKKITGFVSGITVVVVGLVCSGQLS